MFFYICKCNSQLPVTLLPSSSSTAKWGLIFPQPGGIISVFLASGLHMNSDHIFTFINCFTAEDSKFWALWPFEFWILFTKWWDSRTAWPISNHIWKADKLQGSILFKVSCFSFILLAHEDNVNTFYAYIACNRLVTCSDHNLPLAPWQLG